jgi:hypothetical protein
MRQTLFQVKFTAWFVLWQKMWTEQFCNCLKIKLDLWPGQNIREIWSLSPGRSDIVSKVLFWVQVDQQKLSHYRDIIVRDTESGRQGRRDKSGVS